jgi:type IV fimbrial biogenesis protein FimT
MNGIVKVIKMHHLKNQGFSLIELMITITIFGILTSVAIPSYTTFMTASRLSNQNTALMLDFVFARGEAATRAKRVTVCQSANGTACSAGGWHTGRIVFIDNGSAGVVDNGDEILRVAAAINTADAMTSTTSNTYISYNAAGVPNTNIVIKTCQSGFHGAKVTIYPSGRISKDKVNAC